MCRLFIECTIDPTTSKLERTIAKFKKYRKAIFNEINDAQKINVEQIYYVKDRPPLADIKKLKKAGIFLLTENALDYFITLSIQYKKLSFYQFMNLIFNNKEIKYLKDQYSETGNKFEAKALEAKDKLGTYYVFSANPYDLIPISTVPHRKMSSIDEELSQSYQRLISSKKIKGIHEYIMDDSQFPTNLIFHFNDKRSVNFQGGKISFTPKWGFINVIDGQHRLFAYMDQYLKNDTESNSKNLKNFLKTFHHHNSLLDLSTKKQINTFVNINEKQTPVSKNLLWIYILRFIQRVM